MSETRVFTLYQTLFPNEEQDSEQDIVTWIFYENNGEPVHHSIPRQGPSGIVPFKFVNQWDSWFPVLTLRGRAIAFAYIEYAAQRRLFYGNFVGVQKAWRPGSIADIFWNRLQKRSLDIYPECRGMMFEVEEFDLDEVERIISYLEEQAAQNTRQQRDGRRRSDDGAARGFWGYARRAYHRAMPFAGRGGDGAKDSEEWQAPAYLFKPNPNSELPDETVIRRFLRFMWYDRRRVKVFKDKRGQALTNRYPCVEPEGKAEEDWPNWEVDFWPGWFTARTHDHTATPYWEEVVTFSSTECLLLAKAPHFDHPDRYLTYGERLVKRVIAKAPGDGVHRRAAP